MGLYGKWTIKSLVLIGLAIISAVEATNSLTFQSRPGWDVEHGSVTHKCRSEELSTGTPGPGGRISGATPVAEIIERSHWICWDIGA